MLRGIIVEKEEIIFKFIIHKNDIYIGKRRPRGKTEVPPLCFDALKVHRWRKLERVEKSLGSQGFPED